MRFPHAVPAAPGETAGDRRETVRASAEFVVPPLTAYAF
jgi:hypothetical protein